MMSKLIVTLVPTLGLGLGLNIPLQNIRKVVYSLLAWWQTEETQSKLLLYTRFLLYSCFQYLSSKESTRDLFISANLSILPNDPIRGFLESVTEGFYVESKHPGLHNGVPLQIPHHKSLWSSGGNPSIAAQHPSPLLPSSTPNSHPSGKIIHFHRPTVSSPTSPETSD